MHRFGNHKVHAVCSRSDSDSFRTVISIEESIIGPRIRRDSISQSLTQAFMSGTLLRKKKSLNFYSDGDLVKKNSEVLLTGKTINILIENEKNIRAEKNRLQLIKHYITSWYRRWANKHTENPFFKSYINYIECNFGSGIGSLFVFTRWIIQMNFFLSLIWFAMVVLPTAIAFDYSSISLELTFWNVFDGEGAVRETWLFYGGFPEIIGGVYHLAVIYLLLILITYFGSLFIIMDSLGESDLAISGTFSKSYKISSILFSSWDHSITSSYAAENLSKGIASVLKDDFSEDKAMAHSEKRNRREANNILCLRILAWLITIVLIGGACTSIVFVVINLTFSDSKGFHSTYLPSIIFSLINVVIPKIVTMLPEYLEHYGSGKTEFIITVSRIFILRMANLLTFIATLYRKSNDASAVCTGTVIGQEFYKLIFVDTLVHATVEILMTVAEYKWTNEKLEFNISSAVLVLIYRQGLIWVGTLTCPLMPLFGFLSNLVFFFMFYNIIKNICKPPMQRWDQSGDTAFQMGFLLTTLLLIIVPVSIVIGSNEVIQLGQTSVAGKTCGPFGDMKLTEAYGRFRQQCTMNTVNHILKWFVSDSVLVPLFFLLLSLLNYQRNLLEGEKQYRLLLQAELEQEREDNRLKTIEMHGY